MEIIGRGRASAEEIPKLSPLQELVGRSNGAIPVSIASSVAASNRMAWGQWTRSSVAEFDDCGARLFAKMIAAFSLRPLEFGPRPQSTKSGMEKLGRDLADGADEFGVDLFVTLRGRVPGKVSRHGPFH